MSIPWKIKWKFFLLAVLTGILIAAVSIVGYVTSYRSLRESIVEGLGSAVGEQALTQDAWIRWKAGPVIGLASALQSTAPSMTPQQIQEILRTTAKNDEVTRVSYADETGRFVTSDGGDIANQMTPMSRPWYRETKETNKFTVTPAFKDAVSGNMIRTISMPLQDAQGNFRGAVCVVIELSVLQDLAQKIKYHGFGTGMFISRDGTVLASSRVDNGNDVAKISDIPELGQHFDEMKQNGRGYFDLDTSNGSMLFAYHMIPMSGALAGIIVPRNELFSSLHTLRITYICLTLFGLIISSLFALKLSNDVAHRAEAARHSADVMANGDLSVPDLQDGSPDELGDLTRSFNMMKKNLRNLVSKITRTSEQVASSSEELTASASQSAQASTDVAKTVATVADGVNHQAESVKQATALVSSIYTDIERVAEKAKRITENQEGTRKAAQQGASLMQRALECMTGIESASSNVSAVVKRLGESSGQINEIVDAISAIAQQTNLLALNAAIEAARAGDSGRGFAVVADEVRKLAEESQSSAEKIRERIAQIQGETEEAVAAMEASAGNVEQGTGAIRDVSEHFGNILTKIASIHGQLEEINKTMGELSGGMKGIVGSIEGIDKVVKTTSDNTQSISASTEEQSSSAEEIAEASRTLAHMAQDLQEATSHFKV